MASLYKKPVIVRDPRTGEKIKTKSRKWWGRFKDEFGKEKRVPLANDKSAAQAMLNEQVRQAERRAAGIEDPGEKHRRRPITEHIRAFEKHLVHKNSTKDYVQTTVQRIKAIVTGCRFERIDQISASRVQQYLAELRSQGKSIASSNHYLRAIKMFTRWLVRDRRAHDDRLAYLSKLNADLDRRRVRRPLSVEEFDHLLQAAAEGQDMERISGPDRAILYIVATYTGYRRNEIGSVTQQSFNFDSDPPTLTVQAGHSKHRRTDIIPLRRDFADRIQQWIRSKGEVPATQPLFPVTDKRTSDMIRRDLAAARTAWLNSLPNDREGKRMANTSFLAYEDDHGRVVDFHSLRNTFITNLTRSGVAPKTAQLLARHSDINLTMNTYTMLGMLDQVSAVEALPPIPLPGGQTASSTSPPDRISA